MTGHINIMLVLQSCTDSLQVMAGSSNETFPLSSDCTYDGGNIKVEEHIDTRWDQKFLDNCYKTQITSYIDMIYFNSSKYISP